MAESHATIRRRPGDIGAAVVAALLLAVAALALWQSRGFSPLGSIFPRTIGIGLLLSGLAALVRALRGRGARSRGIARDGLLRSACLVAIMVLWTVLLERAGFVVTSAGAFFLIALVADREPVTPRRLALFAVASVVVVTAFELLFVRALHVQLPHGALI